MTRAKTGSVFLIVKSIMDLWQPSAAMKPILWTKKVNVDCTFSKSSSEHSCHN